MIEWKLTCAGACTGGAPVYGGGASAMQQTQLGNNKLCVLLSLYQSYHT